jgi:hypothetical protein
MNRKTLIAGCVIVAGGLALVASAGTGLARQLLSERFVKARGIAKSDNVAILRFWLPSGAWVEAQAREGSLVRVKRDGQIFGLAARMKGPDTPTIILMVLKITPIVKNGTAIGEAIEQMESIHLVSGALAMPTQYALPFEIEVVGIGKQEADSHGVETASLSGTQPSFATEDECCIDCEGFTFCGCKVRTSCGNCCLTACC